MEKWDAYDKYRRKMDVELIRGVAIPEGMRHIVVHMIYVNSNKKILLQRRAENKSQAPGMWAFTGGSALSGESSAEACVRETEEELGFTPDMEKAELIVSYARPDAFVDVYLLKCDIDADDMKLQAEEVAEVKWFSSEEVERLAADSKHFWKHIYFDMVFSYLCDMKYI